MSAAAPPDSPDTVLVYAWRHPRPEGAEGFCIGHTDLGVDRRKARRLAYRMRDLARRHHLPRQVVTSPLRRCADVGRILRSWGWVHRIDPALIEMDFGQWDGRRWGMVPQEAVDAWCSDLLHNSAGGGETLLSLLRRVHAWQPGSARLMMGHAGWLCAAAWIAQHGCAAIGTPISADAWPAAPGYAKCSTLVRVLYA